MVASGNGRASVYAVIKTGGKQYRVAEGDRVEVELLGQADGDVSFSPLWSSTAARR